MQGETKETVENPKQCPTCDAVIMDENEFCEECRLEFINIRSSADPQESAEFQGTENLKGAKLLVSIVLYLIFFLEIILLFIPQLGAVPTSIQFFQQKAATEKAGKRACVVCGRPSDIRTYKSLRSGKEISFELYCFTHAPRSLDSFERMISERIIFIFVGGLILICCIIYSGYLLFFRRRRELFLNTWDVIDKGFKPVASVFGLYIGVSAICFWYFAFWTL